MRGTSGFAQQSVDPAESSLCFTHTSSSGLCSQSPMEKKLLPPGGVGKPSTSFAPSDAFYGPLDFTFQDVWV